MHGGIGDATQTWSWTHTFVGSRLRERLRKTGNKHMVQDGMFTVDEYDHTSDT